MIPFQRFSSFCAAASVCAFVAQGAVTEAPASVSRAADGPFFLLGAVDVEACPRGYEQIRSIEACQRATNAVFEQVTGLPSAGEGHVEDGVLTASGVAPHVSPGDHSPLVGCFADLGGQQVPHGVSETFVSAASRFASESAATFPAVHYNAVGGGASARVAVHNGEFAMFCQRARFVVASGGGSRELGCAQPYAEIASSSQCARAVTHLRAVGYSEEAIPEEDSAATVANAAAVDGGEKAVGGLDYGALDEPIRWQLDPARVAFEDGSCLYVSEDGGPQGPGEREGLSDPVLQYGMGAGAPQDTAHSRAGSGDVRAVLDGGTVASFASREEDSAGAKSAVATSEGPDGSRGNGLSSGGEGSSIVSASGIGSLVQDVLGGGAKSRVLCVYDGASGGEDMATDDGNGADAGDALTVRGDTAVDGRPVTRVQTYLEDEVRFAGQLLIDDAVKREAYFEGLLVVSGVSAVVSLIVLRYSR